MHVWVEKMQSSSEVLFLMLDVSDLIKALYDLIYALWQ